MVVTVTGALGDLKTEPLPPLGSLVARAEAGGQTNCSWNRDLGAEGGRSKCLPRGEGAWVQEAGWTSSSLAVHPPTAAAPVGLFSLLVSETEQIRHKQNCL